MEQQGVKYRISLEDVFSKGIKDAESNAVRFENSIDSIGHHLGQLKTELLAAFGITAGFSFLEGAAEKFMESEKAAQQLKFTVGMRGGLASDFQELAAQADHLHETGIFEQDLINQAAQSLLQYGFSVDQVKDNLSIFADAAAASGKPLEEVISAVGAAATGGRTMGLKQFGLGFLDLEKDMSHAGAQARNFDKITKEMVANFKGGMDDITKNTEFGKVANLQNQFTTFKEELGKDLLTLFDKALPSIKKFIEMLREALKWLERHKEVVKQVARVVLDLGIAFGIYTVISKSIAAFQALSSIMRGLKAVFMEAAVARQVLTVAEEQGAVAAGLDAAAESIAGKSVGGSSLTMDIGESIGKGLASFLAGGGAAIAGAGIGFGVLMYLNENAKFYDPKNEKEFKQIIDDKNRADYEKGLISKQVRESHLLGQYQWSPSSAKAVTPPKRMDKGGVDLGSGLSEPKASKIQNITINVNRPFEGTKITSQTLGMALDEIGPKVTEWLTTLVTDAAIVARE